MTLTVRKISLSYCVASSQWQMHSVEQISEQVVYPNR